MGGSIWKELSFAKDGMFSALKIIEMLDGRELKEEVKELMVALEETLKQMKKG